MEHNEAKLRAHLQTEELMMTSMMESGQETSESKRQAVMSALQRWRLFFKMKCRKKRQPAIPGKNHKRSGRAEYEENSQRKLDALLTTPPPPPGMDRSFATLHADRKSFDPQKATHGGTFHRLPLLYRTRVQSTMWKYLDKTGSREIRIWPLAACVNFF